MRLKRRPLSHSCNRGAVVCGAGECGLSAANDKGPLAANSGRLAWLHATPKLTLRVVAAASTYGARLSIGLEAIRAVLDRMAAMRIIATVRCRSWWSKQVALTEVTTESGHEERLKGGLYPSMPRRRRPSSSGQEQILCRSIPAFLSSATTDFVRW